MLTLNKSVITKYIDILCYNFFMLLPAKNCSKCPELLSHRLWLQQKIPDGYNQPVIGFGDPKARIFIIGLAPGANGANRTGRPFTGDVAGAYLYQALGENGFIRHGNYQAKKNDGLELQDVFISNAVKCSPPQHRNVSPLERKNCRPFLCDEFHRLDKLEIIFTLGQTAHLAFLEACQAIDTTIKKNHYMFAHKKIHRIMVDKRSMTIVNSYHCSQRNINTKILKRDDFFSLIASLRAMVADKGKNG
ncbi:MAG: uracil-DNA glycosylase family protein [Alphaproteobacteria bacterium]